MPKKTGYDLNQRTAMLALMVAARDLNNNELTEMTGSSLTGQKTKRLVDDKLIETDTKARPQVHTLTDDGWAWCANALAQGPEGASGSAEKTLYTILAGVHRYLERTGLKPADVFVADPSAPPAAKAPKPKAATKAAKPSAESLIRSAYRLLCREPRGLVSLTELRPLVTGYTEKQVDAALVKMNLQPGVSIIPQSNQKVLTDADRAAMVRIGNEDRLLLRIDEP
jgi:hypothetical protein